MTLSDFFKVDQLSVLMMCLVGFIGLLVAIFSSRHIKGDLKYARFFLTLAFLILSLFIMVISNNALLFLAAWGASNAFLIQLMIHKSIWSAAYESGVLTKNNFIIGYVMICIAFALLCISSGQTSLVGILEFSHDKNTLVVAMTLLFIGAMTQSAIWPFHRWLISSLNSPTPVSAIMHAGLVNGGGFLLARFAILYSELPICLDIIFIIGLITSLVGTFWKLIQSDIKRMLACSTMAQMGFMIAQCGLGLFPAAIAHLCWHGLFKSYLFLSSGSCVTEKRLNLYYPPTLPEFILSLLCGFSGSISFALATHKDIFSPKTTFVLIVISLIAGTQFAMTILRGFSIKRLPLALIATITASYFYGLSIRLIEKILAPLNLMHPQELNGIHIFGMSLLIITWLLVIFGMPSQLKKMNNMWLKFYVIMLNASQPHPKTITSYRNLYQYKGI